MATFVSFVVFSGEFLPIFAAIFFSVGLYFPVPQGYVEQREPLGKLYQAYLMQTLY